MAALSREDRRKVLDQIEALRGAGGPGEKLAGKLERRLVSRDLESLQTEFLGEGKRLIGEATEGIRDFDPEEFFSPEALGALFKEAGFDFDRRLKRLQGTQARRGIRGPIAGAIEGDLASRFQDQLTARAAEFAGARANLSMGRLESLANIGGAARAQGLNVLRSRLAQSIAQANMDRERKAQLMGALFSIGGAAAGSLIPGVGTEIGAAAGASLGKGLAG